MTFVYGAIAGAVGLAVAQVATLAYVGRRFRKMGERDGLEG